MASPKKDSVLVENSNLKSSKSETQQSEMKLESELQNENNIKETSSDIDLAEASKYYEQACAVSQAPEQFTQDSVHVVPQQCLGQVSTTDDETLSKYRDIGLELISKGEVGVLLLAGGQGTRLGVDYPKGMFNVGLPSGKSLFQIQAEKISKVESLAKEKFASKCVLPWYIMTSEFTTASTREFFSKHAYFGLDPEQVVLFQQRSLPCFSLTGSLLFESPDRVCRAPDGSGGIYQALSREGVLADMTERGVRHVLVYCVDNILVKVGDPVFLGYCVEQGAQCGVKVIERTCPEEKLGVLCKVNDKYKVVEYSETSNCPLFQTRDTNGGLVYNLGNTCNHYFNIEFLTDVATNQESSLKFHKAFKKIPCLDENDMLVKPDKPNGIKLEKFIFDALEMCEKLAAWEVKREEEFAPLKNSTQESTDNADTCCQSVFRLHRGWIEAAGGVLLQDETGSIVCEIAPHVSYAGEGLEDRVKGKDLQTPLHLE
uniref:UDP-N-acetylglucosamine diphosphorylase n=1 Tax=Cacopsylla melanoneura TaxID=428564 RepID=A0A8D9BGJ2_9HEMI